MAMARPRPELAPVMTATFFTSLDMDRGLGPSRVDSPAGT